MNPGVVVGLMLLSGGIGGLVTFAVLCAEEWVHRWYWSRYR